MIKKVFRFIRKRIVVSLSQFFGEVQVEFKKSEWKKKAKEFKKIGQNGYVEYPFKINNAYKIIIGENFFANHDFWLEAIVEYKNQKFQPQIIIGDNVAIGVNCHIGAIDKIIIEDNVVISSNIYISDHFHGDITINDINTPPAQRPLTKKGGVIIKKNVWIGDAVCILPGVTIGENTIVGANSVVTKSFPANVVIAGVPAKIIKLLIES